MSYIDLSFRPAAEIMLACLADAVMDLTDPPASTEMRFGSEVAFDVTQNADVCCDGLAWVRMESATPGWGEPLDVFRCQAVVWTLALEVGIVRCAPTPQPEVELLTAAENAAAAWALSEDFMAMRRAICCFDALGYEYTVGAWTPAGPAGGCLGSTVTVSVLVVGNDQFP